MTIDWPEIQGNILRAYLFPRARFLFVELTDADGGIRWLYDVVAPRVQAPPEGRRQPPHVAVNVAFSHQGLAALGTDPVVLAAFPADFREGMWARAARLGDVSWERGWCNQPGAHPRDRERIEVTGEESPPATHVLVAVHAQERADLDRVDAEVRPKPDTPGVRFVGCIELATLEADDGPGEPPADGGRRRARREHFGFADGLSQPRIAGVDRRPERDTTTWWRRLPWWGSWLIPPATDPNPLIQLGEFVLGYPDEGDPSPALPEPANLFRNGSYLVVRKLAQDVPAFRTFMARAAGLAREVGGDGVTEADIASAVVGRRPDGEPLIAAVPGGDADTDLSYRHDPDGAACPLGAHIRRSNPRDGHALGAPAVNRHRLLRRGLPYGPRYDADGPLEVDPVERGLVLVSYGASISRQFEFVQRSWLNDGDAVGIGHNADVISGAPGIEATVAVPGWGRLRRDRPFVTPEGGEYFFVPGISALRRLAAGDLRAARPEPAATALSGTPGRSGP